MGKNKEVINSIIQSLLVMLFIKRIIYIYICVCVRVCVCVCIE
jgi:hypothetical protein